MALRSFAHARRLTDGLQVLDFGASRDGVGRDQRGRRIVVDARGQEVEDAAENETVEADEG